jgi:hypothetical protein
VGLWWPNLHKYCRDQVRKCDSFQRLERPLWKNEIPLSSVNSNRAFEIWVIDFVGPFPQREKRTGAKYIITVVEYMTKWEEVEPVESCTKEVADEIHLREHNHKVWMSTYTNQ